MKLIDVVLLVWVWTLISIVDKVRVSPIIHLIIMVWTTDGTFVSRCSYAITAYNQNPSSYKALRGNATTEKCIFECQGLVEDRTSCKY